MRLCSFVVWNTGQKLMFAVTITTFIWQALEKDGGHLRTLPLSHRGHLWTCLAELHWVRAVWWEGWAETCAHGWRWRLHSLGADGVCRRFCVCVYTGRRTVILIPQALSTLYCETRSLIDLEFPIGYSSQPERAPLVLSLSPVLELHV